MQEKENVFFKKVYFWMFIGLFLSSLSAYFVVTSPALQNLIFGNSFMIFVLFIIEIIMVVAISAATKKLSADSAMFLFFIYSFVNGLTLSSVVLIYTTASIVSAFVMASIMFLAMAVYGLVSKKNMSGFGPVLFGALIGLVVMMIINIFIKSETFNLVIGLIGIVLFMGMTMYDNNMLRKLVKNINGENELNRFAVVGALRLYLDLINLFLSVLRVFGRRR